jgi:hypothetical protein
MSQFDGVNLRIILEPPTASVLAVSVQEDLYSEWKAWVAGIVNFNTETGISSGLETVTRIDHSTYTGQRATYTQVGSESIGLTTGTAYFLREIDRNTVEVYDSKANAEAGPATTGRQNLTASGVGLGELHTFTVDNSKFLLGFRTAGGDPLTPGVEAGAYFFLQNQNGWRIISTDEDQTINYDGNMVGEDNTLPLIVATPGRTVLHLGLQPVTQRVDEILEQQQTSAYGGVIRIDVVNGTPGTTFPIGTRSTPVDNIADGSTLAANLGISTFEFRGTLALDRNLTDWTFEGIGSSLSDSINLNGFSVNRSIFKGCSLTGSLIGEIEAIECSLDIPIGLHGDFRRCGFPSTVTLAAGEAAFFDSCYSEVAGSLTPIIDCNGATAIHLRNYSGGMEFRGIVAGTTVSCDLDPGTVIIADGQGNTGGSILIRGLGTKSVGAAIGTTVIDRLFDVDEAQIAFASIVGNADVAGDDLTVTVLDKNLNNLRELSVSVDGRIRRIV